MKTAPASLKAMSRQVDQSVRRKGRSVAMAVMLAVVPFGALLLATMAQGANRPAVFILRVVIIGTAIVVGGMIGSWRRGPSSQARFEIAVTGPIDRALAALRTALPAASMVLPLALALLVGGVLAARLPLGTIGVTVVPALLGVGALAYLIRAAHRMGALTNHAETSLVVNLAAEQALAVIAEVLGAEARRASPLELTIARGASFFSWGETISVRLEEIDPGACRVLVASRSRHPMTLTDGGVNSKNVAAVLGKIEGPLLTAVSVRSSGLASERVRHQDTEARLARLQAQVEAHFLYNTLAHLGVLIDRDPPSARRMLNELVDYLRASSKMLTAVSTSLGEEVRLVEGYLELMRHRLGGRLTSQVHLHPQLVGTPCLPGVLLTLVENAVKHGIEPSAAGGTISVHASEEGGVVTLEVADTGVGFQAAGGVGTGLANLKERLFTRYGARARLQLEQGREQGVVSTVVFPAAAGAA